jgi:hypothetical protein
VDRASVIKAKIARAKQLGASPEVLQSLRADYYAARARDYLREYLAGDPAPRPEHRRELAVMLAGGEANGTAAA